MPDAPLLHLEGAWKKFGKTVPANRRRLSRAMARSALFVDPGQSHLRRDEFWALRDISFKLRRGEAVGLIGRNGAGKSTLLRLLGGHMLPDRGQLHVNGRVAELINLTAGYQPLLSGRENIRFGATLRGLSPRQARKVSEEIIAFSEVGDFIDAPFGTYSQGMRLRLAFSVAVHVKPDILLIDEVIGVGDYGFRQKCMARLQAMRSDCAVVLCTHNTGHLLQFCDRVLVLDAGAVAFAGDAREAVARYLEGFGADESDIVDDETGEAVPSPPAPNPSPQLGPSYHDEAALPELSAEWIDAEECRVDRYGPADPVQLNLQMRVAPEFAGESLSVIFFLYDDSGQPLARAAHKITSQADGQAGLLIGLMARTLAQPKYYVAIRIAHGSQTLYRNPVPPLEIQQKRELWGQFVPDIFWQEIGNQ